LNPLTVAIPTYKSHATLFELIDTISKAKVYPKLIEEILVSDNDSTSNLQHLLERKYGQLDLPPIRYIKGTENIGYDGNLTRLIQQCKTEFIKFIADDDLFTEDFFISFATILKKYQV